MADCRQIAIWTIVLLALSTQVAARYASAGAGSTFTGFNNETFTVDGKPGQSYNVLSDGRWTVNMELVSAGAGHTGPRGEEGTFIGGMSVLLDSFELYAHADAAGNMTIFMNGLELDIEIPARFNHGLISYEPYAPQYGQVLTIEQQPFKLAIVAVKQFTDEASGYNRGHFDLHARFDALPASQAAGLLGQSISLELGEQGIQDPAIFEVPSLSHRAIIELHTSASRRLLML